LLPSARMPEYPRHLATFDYVGSYQYFLTFCTCNRTCLFVTPEAVSIVHEQILRACATEGFEILAYCYMPDHLHLVIEAQRPDADLKRLVRRAKQHAGFYFKRAIRHELWQRYGYERVLRNEEETWAVVRYVIENPVRAGLVDSPLDYPYWGSSKWTREALLDYVRAA